MGGCAWEQPWVQKACVSVLWGWCGRGWGGEIFVGAHVFEWGGLCSEFLGGERKFFL